MSLPEYDAVLHGWNEAHKREDGDAELEAPSIEWWQEQQTRISANPALTGATTS